jgi:hypothetical protein
MEEEYYYQYGFGSLWFTHNGLSNNESGVEINIELCDEDGDREKFPPDETLDEKYRRKRDDLLRKMFE